MVGQVELDSSVRKVLDALYPDVPIKVWDVKNTPLVHQHLDLACITFPCTETSVAGTRTGRQVTGNHNKVFPPLL